MKIAVMRKYTGATEWPKELLAFLGYTRGFDRPLRNNEVIRTDPDLCAAVEVLKLDKSCGHRGIKTISIPAEAWEVIEDADGAEAVIVFKKIYRAKW